MKSTALGVAILGIYMSYLALASGSSEIGTAMGSSVISGFFGYLQKDTANKERLEALLIIFISFLCLFTFFYDNHNFISIVSILNAAITGYFGLSISASVKQTNRRVKNKPNVNDEKITSD